MPVRCKYTNTGWAEGKYSIGGRPELALAEIETFYCTMHLEYI